MVDVHQPGDYPIVLGDSLKDDASPSSSHLSIRYNWVPKSGLDKNTGRIAKTANGLSLTYDRNGELLKYTGWQSDRADSDRNHQLALFYDASRSVFVLEKLSATLDFNLHSGTNITSDHIHRHSHIVRSGGTSHDHHAHYPDGELGNENDEDGSPDSSNPFDYRHFLADAKETIEKAGPAGNRTPLPGGRTPMSGLSSPMPGSHPFQSTTPQFGPTEIIDATHIEDGPEWGGHRHFKTSKSKSKATRKTTIPSARARAKISPPGKQSQSRPKVLSSERVQDSSDEDSDSDSSAQPSPVTTSTKPKQPAKTTPNKKPRAPPARSPTIVINNDSDSGGLEIDSGSPPPPSPHKRGYKIDADAFRSQTGTPAITRPVSRQSNNARNDSSDIDMPDANHDADEDEDDEYSKYLQNASDSDSDTQHTHQRNRGGANADIDDLILDDGSDSPGPGPPPSRIPTKPPVLSKPARAPALSIKRSSATDTTTMQAPVAQRAPKRRQSSTISRASRSSRSGAAGRIPPAVLEKDRERHATPDDMDGEDDDDDEDGLAAELENAIRERERGVGLGIGVGGRGGEEDDGEGGMDLGVDEESDISEEE